MVGRVGRGQASTVGQAYSLWSQNYSNPSFATVEPYASYLSVLCLSFLIWKIGIKIIPIYLELHATIYIVISITMSLK